MSHPDADILNNAAIVFGITADEITGRHNTGNSFYTAPIHARYALAHILRGDGWPFEAIGCLLGRHHSTIITACRRAQELLVRDAEFAALHTETAKRCGVAG